MICSNKISRGTANDNNMVNLAVYPNTYCPSNSGDIKLECCRSPITGIAETELDKSSFGMFPTLPYLQNEITKGSQIQDVFNHCTETYRKEIDLGIKKEPNKPTTITTKTDIPKTNYIRDDLLIILVLFAFLYMASK
jgi:hypothetical protein